MIKNKMRYYNLDEIEQDMGILVGLTTNMLHIASIVDSAEHGVCLVSQAATIREFAERIHEGIDKYQLNEGCREEVKQ